jgi:hypothetical protein
MGSKEMSDKLAPIAANQSTAELAIWLDGLLQGDRVYHSDYQKFTESANRLRTQSAQITQLQAEVESLKTELHHSSLAATAEAHEVDRINRELKSLRKNGAWQPIETAPKDDDTLILVANEEGVWVAKYRPVYQSGFKPSNPWSSMLLNHDHIKFHKSHAPTHWMPLPKPPTAIAKDTQLDALGEMVKLSQEMGFYEPNIAG